MTNSTVNNAKIIDIITKSTTDGKKPLVSLEFFPPRTEDGVKNLHARMDRMKQAVSPAFTDVTWGAGGSTADLSLQLALYVHETGHCSNMHLTCTNIAGCDDPKAAILSALQKAHAGGIRNIVALRGDPPAGQTEWKAAAGGFTCALDLVKFIREQADIGSDFGISVAGYPEGHPNAITEIADPSKLSAAERARSSTFDGKTYCCLDADYQKEMDYLKQKVDAGADLIITQMFFDVAVFHTFVEDCRTAGIRCPIVPGIMCINNYAGFCKMTKFCKTRVPAALQEKMDGLKSDAAAMKQFGVDFGTQQCQALINTAGKEAPAVLHFYTLNLEKVVYGILENMKLLSATAVANEADAASQVAKGSAWARVGDPVQLTDGRKGVVLELDNTTGSAKIQLGDGSSSSDDKAVVTAAKGEYSKLF